MLSHFRNAALGISFLISFVLHLLGALYLGNFRSEEEASKAFKARLAIAPRFEPKRLGAAKPRQLPTTEMEYLPSTTTPQVLSEIDELLSPEIPREMPSTQPGSLRKFAMGVKSDTVAVAGEKMPAPTDYGWSDTTGRDESLDLLRITDLAGQDRQKAAIVPGQISRRDVTGFINLSRLRVYGAGTQPSGSSSGLDALARYLRDHTRILAQVTQQRYDSFVSENLLNDPVHFLIEGGGHPAYDNELVIKFAEDEMAMLGRYLREGGFLFVEGGYRYLSAMGELIAEILGNDGRLFPLPATHPVYHSFYGFSGGFPTEHGKDQVDDTASRLLGDGFQGSRWYYPATGRPDALVVESTQVNADQQVPVTLPLLGVYGVEVGGELVAILSDLSMYARWSSSFQTGDDGTAQGAEAFLQSGVNIITYILGRDGGVTAKRQRPAWALSKPDVPLLSDAEETARARVEGDITEVAYRPLPPLAAEEKFEIFSQLDASLALVQSPLGTAIAEDGLSIVIDGRYTLDLLKREVHGLILHNVPAGSHWLRVGYGGKSEEMEVQLEGGKVSTVTFGLSRLAMFSSLRVKQQEEVVAVQAWLNSFDDLNIEELFLGDDRQLLEQ